MSRFSNIMHRSPSTHAHIIAWYFKLPEILVKVDRKEKNPNLAFL